MHLVIFLKQIFKLETFDFTSCFIEIMKTFTHSFDLLVHY